MSDKNEYIKQIKEQVNELENRLHDLKKKGERASEEIKSKYGKEIEELKKQKESLQNNLNKLIHSSADTWEDVKKELDVGCKKAKDAINHITSKLKW